MKTKDQLTNEFYRLGMLFHQAFGEGSVESILQHLADMLENESQYRAITTFNGDAEFMKVAKQIRKIKCPCMKFLKRKVSDVPPWTNSLEEALEDEDK